MWRNEAWRKSITLSYYGLLFVVKLTFSGTWTWDMQPLTTKKAWSEKIPPHRHWTSTSIQRSGCPSSHVQLLMLCSSWQIFLEKLYAVHCRHLRYVMDINRPGEITYNNLHGCMIMKAVKQNLLCKRGTDQSLENVWTCSAGPLDGLTFSSLILFIYTGLHLTDRRRRPQSNLFSMILQDLWERNTFLNSIFYGLYYLRHI